MRRGELCAAAGVSPKALRYWEALGLLEPERLANGYRRYSEQDLRAAEHLRDLIAAGVPAGRARPILECAALGGGEDCPASLAAYRSLIVDLDTRIEVLVAQRDLLQHRLQAAATTADVRDTAPADPVEPRRSPPSPPLPSGLPRPIDDGATDHLPGRRMPALTLSSTDDRAVSLDRLPPGRTVIYCYPLTGRADVDLPDGWDVIPGARGCTNQACDFRDHHAELLSAGAAAVYGLSTQTSDYQRELIERLHLPFAMLADPERHLGHALTLPTLQAEGRTLYRRHTLIVRDHVIEHVFHPVFPPDQHASEVLAWLRRHPATADLPRRRGGRSQGSST